ncbi:hypothetical protein [Chamaesiphon sp. VAR_69_metabat_338]|uniref:hypothetical protein n=1 Tax=Chamaesiphon sp. VAR_69_metabat_338 TaxID=2964704 RepID=UPI00286E617A|nr:hypothetical protein [Chamaesiphon sp. VAR_69_metabat_338]
MDILPFGRPAIATAPPRLDRDMQLKHDYFSPSNLTKKVAIGISLPQHSIGN